MKDFVKVVLPIMLLAISFVVGIVFLQRVFQMVIESLAKWFTLCAHGGIL